MAALPANNTTRLFVDYRTQIAGIEHTLLLRPASSDGVDVTATQQTLLNFLNALGPAFFRTGWRVIAVRGSAAGSNITAPVPILPGLASFVGTNSNTYTEDREAVECRFQGRSLTTGVRVSFSLYGVKGNLPIGTFRVVGSGTGDGLLVRNAVAVLNAAPLTVRAIDGTAANWYEYCNVNYNSYWERRIRTGG